MEQQLNTVQPTDLRGLPPWFAVQVRPRWEQAVTAALESKGYECLLPLYESRRRWVDRTVTIKEPLFRGYVFCRWDLCKGAKIVTTPGVIRLVGFGGAPIPVEEHEILAMRRILESGVVTLPHPYLQVGQVVRLIRGPLSGLQGVLVRIKANHTLVVSVNLLQRSVAVEIEDAWMISQDDPRLPVESELSSPQRLSRRRWA